MRKCFLTTLVLFALLAHTSCLQDSYSVKLSGPLTVESDWIELRPQTPLRAEKDVQDVILILTTEFDLKFDKYETGANSRGIVLPAGELINPEVQVIDQYGNSFALVLSGSKPVGRWAISHGPTYSLPSPNHLPRDRVYSTVRIRSSQPVKLKAIYWFCDSVKDWK